MKIKIDNSKKVGNSHIKIMYPGQSGNGKDTGFATLGRIRPGCNCANAPTY
ncbi:MAG: hypothetical protein WKG06_08875 [Segetibacter sp.]